MPISFPDNIIRILTRLETEGFQAYAVGGCIRDSLLGRTPNDWDVCTDARPEDTLRLFGDAARPTGLQHGTVTVHTEGGDAEVTTFRSEGSYSDHRRPDSVSFLHDVREDLARRDFTVNAMAMGLDGVLLDPFGGQQDLAAGRIRCVGNADRRFQEDALRMFRALRFSARLGFPIEEETLGALYRNAQLASMLAVERIQSELYGMLPHACGEQLRILFSSGLMDRFARRDNLDFSSLNALPVELLLRLSGLCALLAQHSLCEPEGFLRALKCPSAHIRVCSRGCAAALSPLPASPADWKRLLHRIGAESCRCACAGALVLRGEDLFPALRAVLDSGECRSLDTLAVKGSDLLALGYRGEAVGALLETLLDHVMDCPSDNEKSRLLSLLPIDGLSK